VGVTAEIVPAVVTPPGEAVLTLEVSELTADGVYTLTLTGTAEVTNVHTIEFGLLVRSNPAIAVTSDSPVELGHTMHFTAEHTGGTVPLTYTWDFGGPGYGANLDTATPVFTYTEHGGYTVVVTAENECGEGTASTSVEVLCYGPEVEVSSDSPVELGEAIHFAADVLSGTMPLTYTWDFGGPGYGTGQDTATPVFTYTAPGDYMATVTVTNACDSDVDSTMVEIQCFGPEAILTTDSPVMIGEAMHFSATLTGTAPLSYTWDFGGEGEGSGLDTLTPVFTYTLPGDYVVSLQMTGPCGPGMVTETVTVDAMAYYVYLPLVRR
jgi:PKD repeat protein